MWTLGCILTNLSKRNAHELLSRSKQTNIMGENVWVNGYEYGLFAPASTCVLLAKTMQSSGRIFIEMVRPQIRALARKKRHYEQIEVMQTMYWDLDVVRAMMNRFDAHEKLCLGEFNGYETALTQDPYLSRQAGIIARQCVVSIASIVSFQVFQQCPLENIKAYYDH